jgi:hypothetical protein
MAPRATGLAALFVVLSGTWCAQAATIPISLTGQVADITPSTCGAAGYGVCEAFLLSLSGLEAPNSVTVHDGDTVDVTVTLDGLFLVNTAGAARVDFNQDFTGNSVTGDPEVNGTYVFSNAGTPVGTFAYVNTTAGGIGSFAPQIPPPASFSFDSFTNDFTITSGTLSADETLTGSQFILFELSDPLPVPEPGAWALMLAGFAGLGVALRSRRRGSSQTA